MYSTKQIKTEKTGKAGRMFNSFKEMPIWQSAMEIADTIFKMTENLPKKEDYGFTSQIRRSALSISANIAEAFGRNSKLDKLNFYYITRGSLLETQSHIEYGRRVGYIDNNRFNSIEKELIDLYIELNKVIIRLKKQRLKAVKAGTTGKAETSVKPEKTGKTG